MPQPCRMKPLLEGYNQEAEQIVKPVSASLLPPSPSLLPSSPAHAVTIFHLNACQPLDLMLRPRNFGAQFPLLVLLSIISLLHLVASAQPCYNHDGSIVREDTACNPDLEQSFCCGPGWTCLDNGICSNHNTTDLTNQAAGQQRASCTDQSFESDQCPQFCPGNPGFGREVATFDNGTFCCVFGNGTCAYDPVITSLKNGVPLTTISVAETSSRVPETSTPQATSITSSKPSSKRSSSSLATTSDAASQSRTSQSQTGSPGGSPTSSAIAESASRSLSTPVKIALGVSIPVCVISVTLAAIALWSRRRARRRKGGESKFGFEKDQLPASHDIPKPTYMEIGYAPQELDQSREYAARGELPPESGDPRAELIGSSTAHELNGRRD